MVSLQHLYFAYNKAVPILEDVNLSLRPGRIYGLLGKNGAGKSSLMYNICGLLFPASGSVSVLGHTPALRRPAFLQQVCLLPEDFEMPPMRISEYLRMYAPFYPHFSHEAFENYMKVFGMPAQQSLQALSHGEQKKVLISFTLATNAKLILMDEPTNGLDIPSKRQFRKVIAGGLQEDQCIVISTHQVKDLDSLIDEVLILEDRRIILQESVSGITEKLSFRQVMSLEETEMPVYSEGSLKGYAVVAVNRKAEQSRMDMEMFFNAVMTEKEKILSLFQR
ncbi:ATP-binding cassette domain-containing protein [Chitinophaga sp. GCM10012297]|uniref:ABC transporter ATP-binding protein n=1 Tax=Chitinophaga chungangae TaxID=2821488 RepID=A0ABS3YIS6_9BACT|nr:ABC transporter ATP-binding protein [Chitinophaga chungangae]MBO9154549.1 ABC transporter ATP-binding protein [Chitinophaga chungangae]